MIESLQLRNFQIHKSLHLEFDPYVTTIIGPTDSGKTAIIRAIGWVVFNRPRGREFARHSSRTTRVSLQVDCRQIARVYGKGNIYRLDGRVFKAFGSGVPPDVSGLLSTEQLNLQQQHDPPFWLTLTPGQLTKELNELVDLNLLDRCLSYVFASHRRAKVELDLANKRLAELRQEKRELAWVSKADRQLTRIERLHDKLTKRKEQTVHLKEIVQELRQLEKAKSRTKLPDTTELDSLWNQWQESTEETQQLSLLISQVKKKRRKLWQLESELKETEQRLKKTKRCPLCGQLLSSAPICT